MSDMTQELNYTGSPSELRKVHEDIEDALFGFLDTSVTEAVIHQMKTVVRDRLMDEVTKGNLLDFTDTHNILVERDAHDPSRLNLSVRRQVPEKIEPYYFRERVGRDPENDDLDRCNCKLVGVGHASCGWCNKCDMPRFICGHLNWESED